MAKVIFKNKKNDFAILGLVFSILFGLPGLIFSIIGLNQIKKTGQEGKGMCIAGIIISAIRMLLVGILLVILMIAVIADEMYLYDYEDDKCNCTQLSWERIDDLIWSNLDTYLDCRDDMDDRFSVTSILSNTPTY